MADTLIDRRFIDFDFGPFGGRCGALPRKTKPGSVFPVFEEAIQQIPEGDWVGLISDGGDDSWLDRLVTRIMDQQQEGSCASNATAQASEIVQAEQYGPHRVVPISAMSIYKQVGSGPNSGSGVDDNLDALCRVGALPLDTAENKARFKHVFAHTGFYTKFPDGWEETAKLFTGQEWFDVTTWGGIITAVLKRIPVVYARSSHCICGVRPVIHGGQVLIKYANSWNGWGDAGYGYDTKAAVSGAIGSYGAWALRTMKIPDFVLKG